MAYDGSAFNAVPGMNINAGPKFRYQTNDPASTVQLANYFAPGANRLTRGAIIDSVAVMGGTPVLKSYVVTIITQADPSNGVEPAVTVALQTTT